MRRESQDDVTVFDIEVAPESKYLAVDVEPELAADERLRDLESHLT